eukprot:TRINITY_DN6341_c0_g1_i4.p1 TRINITY_DN6341_c0_g1~~TRINITY_DN6341_c0_g1_i4.p1  ORF type:complete len:531 (+),score=71.00 TRINITY_DN6341_c0_g1_i4:149-1741(+)
MPTDAKKQLSHKRPIPIAKIESYLKDAFAKRIHVLDGGMGTMIQPYRFREADYRGERFKANPKDLINNNDIFNITKPDVIQAIHEQYYAAGADICETNTFCSTRVSQGDFELENIAYELNYNAAMICRRAAEKFTKKEPKKPRFVAGAIGPTNRTASISPKVEDPGCRNVTFRELVDGYKEQVHGLLDGGVDILFVETIFDTLNAKAALFAIEEFYEENKDYVRVPLIISVTITDQSGRTLSGQTIDAFYVSVAHAKPFCIGLNCALGAKEMRPFLQRLVNIAECYVHCYPNAGLPNPMGGYDEKPPETSGLVREFATSGWINLAGGCCGTTPGHIEAIAKAVQGIAPRVPKPPSSMFRLSGLEHLNFTKEIRFLNLGERCNIAGSREFKGLILKGKYDEALVIARKQVEDGAQIIDINMDEGMLDGVAAMRKFLNLIVAEPSISKVPIMIDSSKFFIVEAGLQCVQGKCIVNSISLKGGEEEFIHNAKLIKRYGAAVVVMAFDEEGQAAEIGRAVQQECRDRSRMPSSA